MFIPVELAIILLAVFLARIYKTCQVRKIGVLRVVLGSVPINNNIYWRDAISQFAKAETYTSKLYSIHKRENWDFVVSERLRVFPGFIQGVFAFCEILFKYDVLVTSYKGFFLDSKPYWRIQSWCFKVCKLRSIVIPFGSDAYIYSRVHSPMLLRGLMQDYPHFAKQSREVIHRIDYWNRNADLIVQGFMGIDGLGRWDLLLCSPLIIDTSYWIRDPKKYESSNLIKKSKITIGHFPNHQSFKGTKFIVAAIEILKDEGFDVELLVLSGLSRDAVRDLMLNEIDILFDQINFVGYALTAIEAMACSLPVLANLEQKEYTMPFYYYSYLSECPIQSVDHSNLVDQLRILVSSKELRERLGQRGREYVEKFHSMQFGTMLFQQMINNVVYGIPIDLSHLEPNLKNLLKKGNETE